MSSDAPPRAAIVAFAAVVALSLALMAGCSDMTFFRAKSDYFPLVSGSSWTYNIAGMTEIDSVAGDSTVNGQSCVVVLRDYAPEYWTKGLTEVRQLTSISVNRNGQDYPLEERYGLIYELPFVLGATWSDSYRDTIAPLGTDTIKLSDSLSGRVAAIEDIATPAGTFIQCYRIDTYHDIRTVEASDTTDSLLVYSEWFAPDVGLVQRVTGTDTLVLTNYESGH